jgi:hypothetical protein
MAAPANSGIRQLRPTTGTDEQRNQRWFIAVATWPDLVRDGKYAAYSHPSWHFADHYWKAAAGGPVDVTTIPAGDSSSVERLGVFGKALKQTGLADSLKAVDLAWILHLVGDVHQPLHNSSRVTAQLPKGDRGGNSIKLSQYMNLHSYWDDILDLVYEADKKDGLGKTAKKQHEGQPAYIDNWATTIAAKHGKSVLPSSEPLDGFDSWSRAGLALAEQHAYTGITSMKMPGAAYRTSVSDIAQKSIAEGGYRLANLLNSVLQ